MITFNEIASRIDKKSKLYFKRKKQDFIETILDECNDEDEKEDKSESKDSLDKVIDYTPPIFNIYESEANGAQKKLYDKLSKVLAFVYKMQHIRYKDACTIIPLSGNSKYLQQIWGSQKNVSRAIQYMKEIGLLEVNDDTYQFNGAYEYLNRSKTYRYYKENEDKIIEYCSEHNIKVFETKNYEKIDEQLIKELIDTINYYNPVFDTASVRFSCSLKLERPHSMSVNDFETFIINCLYTNYPELEKYQKLCDSINEKYYKDYPEFRLTFVPTIKWNKSKTKIKGIGIRATNHLTNESKDNRPLIRTRYGLKYEVDVRSSIPRLTLSINSGKWIDQSIDIYKLIFDEMYPDEIFDNETREAIKELHMRVYFEKNEKELSHHVWLKMNRDNVSKDEVDEQLQKLRKAVVKAEGSHLFGTEIFFIESCIYIGLLADVLAGGHITWQVYDCLYTDNLISQDKNVYEHMLKARFYYFYNNCKWLPHRDDDYSNNLYYKPTDEDDLNSPDLDELDDSDVSEDELKNHITLEDLD